MKYKKRHTKRNIRKIRLSTSAKCYDANYQYSWSENVEEQKTANGYKKIITPKLNSVVRTGPYYEKLRSILQEEGLGSDMDLELVLRIAENIDPLFQIDYMIFGTPMEIDLDTEISDDFQVTSFLSIPALAG